MAFDTSLLDTALARHHAARERERQAVLEEVVRLLETLGPRYGICQAYIFGSVTRPGHFRTHSDVDIAVERSDPHQFFEAMGAFAMALDREVDLVELRKCRFAARIRSTGIRWTRTPSPS